MRSTAIVASLLACLGIAGCTSSSGVDGLAPSLETTSSIPRPDAAVPQADVGTAAPAEAVVQTAQVEEVAEPAEPEVTPIALVAVPKPALREAPYAGGKIHRHRFRDAKPINFGKRSPTKLAVHGVDVSRWQREIDWPKLRSQGANFAYIKATDGGDHLDPMFRKNWRAAGEAGLRRGAYHFFYWCRTAGEQADWFIRNVPKVAGALPPVIDVEWNGDSKNCRKRPSRAKVLEKMQVFMDRLEAHYGQRPIIYTAPDFYRDNLRGAFPDHPFWLRSVAAHPAKVYPGRKWVFWQYSGSGLSHGVQGRIDLNVFHGDESKWRAWVGQNAG
ncbi:glycoside hydrolase family 25 protein [Allomesorhizobium camelthorni]|uniref:Glycoside hydrolase family 25 protein n=1 Tax=Allomesorhizobium camelthorni TaxID=475069 RepID=A0A6G4W9Y4_9HYPH|nr:GH25 family lysozyme [Mesorhizobium camelthorni]NGO51046.1 glycoside hydrolase family 25 protein [Mesorhizobium camelthorni]